MYKHIFSLLIFLILSLLTCNSAFKDNFPTCESYVANTYLYMALGICIIGYTTFVMSNYQLQINFWNILCIFVLSLLLIIFMHMIPSKNFISMHFIWLLLLLCLGAILYPSIVSSNNYIIGNALLITILIFFVMTCVAYLGYDKMVGYKETFGIVLFVALLTIILLELFYIIIGYPENMRRNISYFVILLFSVFIIYDTIMLKERSRLCSKKINPANYPKESVHFVLDLLNIFVRTLYLSQ